MSEEPKRRPRLRRLILEVVVVLGVFFAVRSYQQRELPTGPAPELHAVDLAGQPVEDLGARTRPVLVHFFASWCGVCDAEEPNLAALAREYDVVAVATQSGDAERVRRWIADETDLAHVRVVPDPRGALAAQWGVSAFPTSFYLSPDGTIAHVEVGYTSLFGMRLRMWSAGRGGADRDIESLSSR